MIADEAMLRGSQAVIKGRVRNISDKKLESITVDLELERRADKQIQTRSVPLAPHSLAPGEEGQYILAIQSADWSGARVTRLRSTARNSAEIAFSSSPGARRPPERNSPGKTRILSAPRPRPKNEEFINTPDNPDKIY